MQSLVHIENGILQQLTGQGNEDWGKKKRSQGNVEPQAQSNNLFNPPASCRVLQAH